MSENKTQWLANAACTGKTNLFFAPMDEKRNDKRLRERKAIMICLQCPVMYECRLHAREHGELGIWGGETEEQRFAAGFIHDPWVKRNARAREKRSLKKLESSGNNGVG